MTVPTRGRRQRRLGSRVGQQQWMARAWPTMVVLNLPTAQALVAEVAATADREVMVPGLGAGTCFQAVPFQRRIRPCSVVVVSEMPAAQTLAVEVAVTPVRRVLLPGAGGGAATLVGVLAVRCGRGARPVWVA